MASRQLRKLRKQQELLNSQNEAPETKVETSEEEEEEVVAKPRGNMFSFAALGDMGDGNDDDDDDDDDEDEEPEPSKPVEKEVASPQAEPAKKKSKKKKKKKGKQPSETPAAERPKAREDELEKALKELNIKAKKQRAGAASAASSSKQNPDDQLNDLLKIDSRHLKAANEMRRLFGKAMDLAQVEERQETRQRILPENLDLETYLSAVATDPRRSGPAKPGMFETLLRTNPFIEGKKSWPRGAAQGLIMKRLSEGTPDVVEFTFAHEKAYDDLEGSFFQLVQMGDPMQIIHFLHRNPYHVSSLIQGSKVARQDQNSALAADLIERALFTFGRVTLSDFRRKLEQGKARINFARPENRQFYLAGYNLIQKLILKGTYRTALEWSKLYLSLNHDDPYALLNWVPVLALRSREAEWFVKFCDALASRWPDAVLYPLHTLPLAYLQLDDYDTAHETLVKNIETLPWLYGALFSALSLDTPQSIWGHTPRNDDDKLYTELYLHISKDLWNNPNAISLLKSAANKAKKLLPIDVYRCPQSPEPTLAVARFIYLDSTPSLMTLVPRKLLHDASPNFEFDPLPPAAVDNIFSSEIQKLPWKPDSIATRGLFSTQMDPRREAGMRAAAERLLAEMPQEELEAMLEVDDGGGGGIMGFFNALMGRVRPRAAGDGGAAGQGQQPRGPFQATVEDGEEEDDDDDDDDDSDDEDTTEFGGNWDGRTRHDLTFGVDEEDDEEAEWTDPEDFDGEGAFGEGPSIAEVMEYMRMRVGYPPVQMPGAWMSDEEDEEESEEDTDEEMPALEDPEMVDRGQGQGQAQGQAQGQ